MSQKITPSLWFDNNMEEAVAFYAELFDDCEVLERSYWPEGGHAPAGTLLGIKFRMAGMEFSAINGGPIFKFNEAVSFEIRAETQDEIDFYWNKITGEGGEESQCGWCKDRFGLWWQIVPPVLHALLSDPDPGRASRAMAAMLEMKKLDIATIVSAAEASA